MQGAIGVMGCNGTLAAPKVDVTLRANPLFADFIGAPGRIRTPDPQIRSLVLYPAELPVPGRVSGRFAAGPNGPNAKPRRLQPDF